MCYWKIIFKKLEKRIFSMVKYQQKNFKKLCIRHTNFVHYFLTFFLNSRKKKKQIQFIVLVSIKFLFPFNFQKVQTNMKFKNLLWILNCVINKYKNSTFNTIIVYASNVWCICKYLHSLCRVTFLFYFYGIF